ncbi:MAG TPA: alpha/beta fold hydrolase [Solirubrobacteraceae bacterium]
MRLLCFPHAGGGASTFDGWADHAETSVELLVVQAPGREDRALEVPAESIEEMADAVAGELDTWHDRPLALFGHSFGALVAYEVARRLENRGEAPSLLAVAGASAPPMIPAVAPLAALDPDAFVKAIVRRGDVPAALLDHPELLRALLAPVRADFAALSRYRVGTPTPLTCAVHAIAARSDAKTPVAMMRGWATLTTGPSSQTVLSGDHRFLTDHTHSVVQDVTRAVQSARASRTAA